MQSIPRPRRQVAVITLESFDRLTETERYALGQCAIQQYGGHHPRTLESLVKKGMLVRREKHMGGHPPLVITLHEVPVGVHMLWCSWCDKNVTEEDLEKGFSGP